MLFAVAPSNPRLSAITARSSDRVAPATAPDVQLVSRVGDERDQLLFHEMMNIFRLTVVEKRRRRRGPFTDLLESLQNADQLVGGNYAGALQSTRMRAAGRKLVTQQPSIE